jgi:hypothetical protein
MSSKCVNVKSFKKLISSLRKRRITPRTEENPVIKERLSFHRNKIEEEEKKMNGKGSRGWETSAAAMPTSTTGAPSELSVIESFIAGMIHFFVSLFLFLCHSVPLFLLSMGWR